MTYEYQVGDHKYTKKITFTDTGVVVRYPEVIDIYFDDKNPKKAYADVELTNEKQKQSGCYTSIIISIIVIIVVFNLLKLF